jgi:hypothetical protein
MRRRLTTVESAGLGFGRLYPNIFAVSAHVKGEIALAELRHAIDKVCQKRPFLAAHMVTDDVEWYETDGTEPIPVIQIDREWSEAVIEYLNIPFDNLIMPQLRFLLRNHHGYSDLVLLIDHSIADGLAATYILRDVLYYIGCPNEVVIPLENRPSLDKLLPLYNIDDTASLPVDTGDAPITTKPRTLFIVPWSLSEAETAALITHCRQHKVSIHSALCTAFLNVFAALDPSGRTLRSVSSPVSVRNRLTQPVGEQVGLYINAGIRTDLDCIPTRDFWEMAQAFNELLTAATSNDDALFIPIVMFHNMLRGLAQFGALTPVPESGGRADYDFSLSNLGNLDFPRNYGQLELDSIYGPMLNSFIDETIIGVATTAGKMTFSLISRERMMDHTDALRVRDQFMVLLAKLLGS